MPNRDVHYGCIVTGVGVGIQRNWPDASYSC